LSIPTGKIFAKKIHKTEGIPSRSSRPLPVSHSNRKNNRIRRQQQIEMAVEVSLDLMIDFLERVVIPSFAPRLRLSNEEARETWMTKRFKRVHIFRELSGEYLEELLILFGPITTKKEANEKLKELETRRSEEIQQQQQTSKSSKSFPP
jgi:hypothetical protein